jgi:hypothetical protein
MQVDRLVDALERLVFRPGEQVDERIDRTDIVLLTTSRPESGSLTPGSRIPYEAQPADWLIRDAPWVDEAVRVVVASSMNNFSKTYGLIFPRQGDVLFLNRPAVMRDLGRALHSGLDPMAYAELLGELYSGDDIDDELVYAFSATEAHRPGALVRDVAEFLGEYPGVDPSLVAEPSVHREASGLVLEFVTYRYYLMEIAAGVDVYRWVVTAPAGQSATWDRSRVQRLELR